MLGTARTSPTALLQVVTALAPVVMKLTTTPLSGLIAGAGLIGVLAAVFEVFGVPTLVDPDAGY